MIRRPGQWAAMTGGCRLLPALALALLPGLAWAFDRGLHVDAEAIRGCFHATPAGARSAECIGRAAGDCQGLEWGDDTPGITRCLALEAAEWDRIADRQLDLLDRELVPLEVLPAAGLDRAQQAWRAWVDLECGLRRHGGGTIVPVHLAKCRMERSAERALDLRRMRDTWHPTGQREGGEDGP